MGLMDKGKSKAAEKRNKRKWKQPRKQTKENGIWLDKIENHMSLHKTIAVLLDIEIAKKEKKKKCCVGFFVWSLKGPLV